MIEFLEWIQILSLEIEERAVNAAVWEEIFHSPKVKATSRSEQAYKDHLRVNTFDEMVR